jgi:HEAT repeat protein
MLDLGQLDHDIRALSNGDDACRRQAIHSLKDHGEQEWATAPREAIRSLVEWLQNQLASGTKRASSRQEVVTILGKMGRRAEPALPQLIDLLKEGVPDGIRETAATALGKIGNEVAVDPLLTVLLKCRATLAVRVVRALGDLGCAGHKVRTALVDLWLSATHSQTSQLQIAIALCELKIDAEGLLRILTSTLVTHKEASLRRSAAEALAWCSEHQLDVVPALLAAALSDTDETVRQVAEAGLARLHLSHEKAVQVCSKQLKESSYAETALRNSGRLAVSVLAKALGTRDPAIQEKAARTLGRLGESATEAIPAFIKALHDKDLDVRLAAAKGLWNITKNAEVVVPALVELLENARAIPLDGSEARRRYLQTVIEALRRMGPPAKGAIPALIARTKDSNRHISESAVSALREIAPDVVIKAR